jgi:uncharacterized protein YbcI
MAVSKGELENRISQKLTRWEKSYFGRGSVLVKTDIVRNMIIVMLKNCLTPAEQKLAETRDGMISIKSLRDSMLESGKEELHRIIKDLTGQEVVSFHTDLSTRTGERMMIFILSDNLEKQLSD